MTACAPARADTWVSEAKSADAKPIVGDEDEDERLPVVSFNEYRERFKNICFYAAQDGRQELLYRVLKAQDVKDVSCPPCRPFFALFSSVCKPPTKPEDKKKPRLSKKKPKPGAEPAEPEPTEIPSPSPTPRTKGVQREPNVRLVDAMSSVFSDMHARKEDFASILAVTKKFLTALRQTEGKAPAERDYLEILASIAESPFRRALGLGAEGAKRGSNAVEHRDSSSE